VERNQIAVSMSLCEAVVALVMTNINQVGDSMTVRWVSINITQLKMQLRLACFVWDGCLRYCVATSGHLSSFA